MTDNKPVWDFPIKEDLAAWLVRNAITKIEHKWKMTGADTADYWIVLVSAGETRKVPTNFFRNNEYFQFSPYHAGLVESTKYKGDEMKKRLIERINWEKNHEREREEYERLRKKFEERVDT